MISIIFFFLAHIWTRTEMVSLSDFDQQQHPDAISTINNKHYQFHQYDENSFNENENSDVAMQSPLNRGPYFDVSASRNITALVGSTAYLNCRVRNLGNKTVWFFLAPSIVENIADKLWKMICGCCIAGQLDKASRFASFDNKQGNLHTRWVKLQCKWIQWSCKTILNVNLIKFYGYFLPLLKNNNLKSTRLVKPAIIIF